MKDCTGINNSCTNTVGPDQGLNRDGTVPETTAPGACTPDSGLDTNTDLRCKPFTLENNKGNDYIETLTNEALSIGGATFNVFKLLGVHEQGKLVDCSGRGTALSNGDLPNFPSSNAFDKFVSEWRSIQRGAGVQASAYIGYDFGNIKTNDDSRAAYGIETSIYKRIATIAIKQSSNPNRRITRARVERSDDGKKWYGVEAITLPNDDCLNTIQFKDSVPARYWRIRPLDFNGVTTNDVWGVVAFQLFHDYVGTDLYNIQDKVLLENRDRNYDQEAISIKGYYDLTDNLIDVSGFGIELPSLAMYITVSFVGTVAALGRPPVIGDILEVPSEAQFSGKMEKILKWVEITDIGWATEGYTPGWRPTLLRLVAQPAFATQETQDIFGDLAQSQPDDTGSVIGEDGNNITYQDFFDVSQTVEIEARDAVPERGAEGSSTIRAWETEEIQSATDQGLENLQKIGLHSTGLYVEDAMPPNNAEFTEDDAFPPTPNNADYHRLTYSGLAADIPARLYRYSNAKGRWIFLETDLRALHNPTKPTLREFITSPNAVDNREITQNRETLDKDC